MNYDLHKSSILLACSLIIGASTIIAAFIHRDRNRYQSIKPSDSSIGVLDTWSGTYYIRTTGGLKYEGPYNFTLNPLEKLPAVEKKTKTKEKGEVVNTDLEGGGRRVHIKKSNERDEKSDSK